MPRRPRLYCLQTPRLACLFLVARPTHFSHSCRTISWTSPKTRRNKMSRILSRTKTNQWEIPLKSEKTSLEDPFSELAGRLGSKARVAWLRCARIPRRHVARRTYWSCELISVHEKK